MTYEIIMKAPKTKRVTKTVKGIRELHTTLAEYRGQGYEIKRISRPRKMISLVRRLQAYEFSTR